MKALKFTIDGQVNSFRRCGSGKYHSTYLIPPKTTIIGLLVNCMGKGRQDFAKLLKNIKISVVPLGISSKFVDVWRYKWRPSGKKQPMDALMRENLLYPSYKVYVFAEDNLLNEIKESITKPMCVPYLGMSDDAVYLKDISFVDLDKQITDKVDSSFYGLEIHRRYIHQKNISIKEHFVPIATAFDGDSDERIPCKYENICDFTGFSFQVKPYEGYIDGDLHLFAY